MTSGTAIMDFFVNDYQIIIHVQVRSVSYFKQHVLTFPHRAQPCNILKTMSCHGFLSNILEEIHPMNINDMCHKIIQCSLPSSHTHFLYPHAWFQSGICCPLSVSFVRLSVETILSCAEICYLKVQCLHILYVHVYVIKNWMHSFEVSLGYESVDRITFSTWSATNAFNS